MGNDPYGDYDGTYSPEDNKLRLYAATRLDSDTYARVKKAGFRWAPKPELFVAPAWTPEREDLLLELAGEIDDENYSAADRSADRAERFADYRDKRRHEAHGHADAFDAGPAVFGHRNHARAERQARRHDRHRGHALTPWSKAEYWQTRTGAVIGHALYKAKPGVRRSRILRLEAEQRKHAKTTEQVAKRYAAWQKGNVPRSARLRKQSIRNGPGATWRRRSALMPTEAEPITRKSPPCSAFVRYGEYTAPTKSLF